MNILVICQYYCPEPVKVSDVCEALVKKGHSVDVITGTPNYPMGEIYEGYRDGKKQDEALNGVNVHRCKIIPRKKNVVFRLMNYLSFPKAAIKYLKRHDKKYDVVFAYQLSPVLMGKPAIYYKKKYGTKVVLYCLDIWPESLKVGGVGEYSPLFKYFELQSARVYKNCDKILVSSKSFTKYLIDEFGISKKRISHLPQYAEAIYDKKSCAKKPDGFIDLMFAGNLGKTQGLEIIVDAAERLKDVDNLRWHFVGDGSEYGRLQQLVKEKNLQNVKFHGRKSADEMPKYYAMADAMLVTLKGGSKIAATLPGKVQTYMAAGKPIIGAIDGEANAVICEAECGFCGPAEDLDEFVENVRRFVEANDKNEMGKKSYIYYQQNFDKDVFIQALDKMLAELDGQVDIRTCTSGKKGSLCI